MRNRIRTIAKIVLTALLGESRLGIFEYYVDPSLKEHWGGAFNGQKFRQQIFLELIQNIQFKAIIEKGTFRGSSTSFMQSTTNLPVYTVECHPRYYNYSRTRFKKNSMIKLSLNDTRSFLRELSKELALSEATLFFYLDAHWHEDLPLKEELRIIFKTWDNSVVMIDDFQVPDDAGYRYDDYGPSKASLPLS